MQIKVKIITITIFFSESVMKKLKEFFSENGYVAVKMLIVHIAISIFGLMLYLPFDEVQTSRTEFLLCGLFGVFSVIFYFFMIYDKIWDLGAQDGIKTAGGRSPASPWKGFLIGLIAAIPDFIICYVYVFFWYFQSYEWAASPGVIFSFIAVLWEGMFIGLTAWIKAPIVFAIAPFCTVLFSGFSYFLGTKDIRLLPIADNPEEAERRREAKANKKKLKAERKARRCEDDEEDELI